MNFFKKFLEYTFLSILVVVCGYFSYVYLAPKVKEFVLNKSPELKEKAEQAAQQKELLVDRGLRTPKITNVLIGTLPEDILEEEVYRDVRLISTQKRPFKENEIALLKTVIDNMPQVLYDYRPWAIISTDFKKEDIEKANPEGVAFASGPYVFVGDITFERSNSFDTGTYRGLLRILAHEFSHVAQYFETAEYKEIPNRSYLENSALVLDWAKYNGWKKSSDGSWMLNNSSLTSDYGKTSPIEDMADSVGNFVIGDDLEMSVSRQEWIGAWFDSTKEKIFIGTIPFNQKVEQRKVDQNTLALLEKHKDATAVTQDLLKFQFLDKVSKDEAAKMYHDEFKKRGWSGSFKNGKGEFTYNRLKVNLEIDENPLRVIDMVLTVSR